MSHQCAIAGQAANHILSCIKSSAANRSREGILSLCSGETPPGVLCPALDPQHTTDMELLEQVQRRAAKMVRAMEHVSYEERLRVGAVQPGEEKAAGRPYCGLSVLRVGL